MGYGIQAVVLIEELIEVHFAYLNNVRFIRLVIKDSVSGTSA